MGIGRNSPGVGLHVDTTAHFSSFIIVFLPLIVNVANQQKADGALYVTLK